MSRSPPTTEAKARLARLRFKQQTTKRARIDLLLQPLIAAALKGPFVRHLAVNERAGLIQFRFAGRRVQYWVGTRKLLVSNAIASTVYIDYQPDQLVRDVAVTNPNCAFNL